MCNVLVTYNSMNIQFSFQALQGNLWDGWAHELQYKYKVALSSKTNTVHHACSQVMYAMNNIWGEPERAPH